MVTFSGAGYANNRFYAKKAYKLSEIIIDEHAPKPEEKVVNPFTNKVIREKINWRELYREEEVGELERNGIINEICQIFNFSPKTPKTLDCCCSKGREKMVKSEIVEDIMLN